MPRRTQGPHLWQRSARRDAEGRITHAPAFVIVDGSRQVGLGSIARAEAEKELARYIAVKHADGDGETRDLEQIPISSVIRRYAIDIAPNHALPSHTGYRLGRLLDFFDGKTLEDLNGQLCRAYVKHIGKESTAKRDLEDLRSAIGHYYKEGLCRHRPAVVLPRKAPPRERWLTRSEVAKLLRATWRHPHRRHIAKFILVALYTGRRAGVVCSASFEREEGCSFIDLDAGYLRPPERKRQTNKRNPPIPLPEKLLIHLRAWHRNGQKHAIEWARKPLIGMEVGRGLKRAAIEIGLGDDVTPHVLRHTAATWQMQAGTDMFEASKYLGMTVQTLMANYAHHSPSHLTAARDAYRKMPKR